MKSAPQLIHQPSKGFTLVELVLAIFLLALLTGMIFSTSTACLEAGNQIVKTQNEEMLHQAFFDFLEKRLSALPGNTRLDLKVTDSPTHYLSDLTLENVPLTFTWGGSERTAKAIQLSTVQRRSGYLDIVLRYYENPIIEPESTSMSGTGFGSAALDEIPFAEIILLSDVRLFEWQLLDSNDMEYVYEWDISGRLPIQMELTCAFGREGEMIRHVFWLPTKQNPEVFMRQLQQGNQTRGGSGNPSTPGGPSIPNPVTPAPANPQE